MLLFTLVPFAAVLAPTLAEPFSRGWHDLHLRESLTVTEDDVDRLGLYAQYARSAVCNVDGQTGVPVTCDINCDRVEADNAIIVGTYYAPDTQVAAYLAVVESRGQVVFVVRPTINDANWSTNCNYTTISSDLVEGGMIHGGFKHAWSEISDDVLSDLEQVAESYPRFHVVSIGHSLGGAVATVAAADLRALGYNVDIYTYGAPRVGNDILSDFISNQGGSIYRVTHNGDIVPRVPLAVGDVYGGQYKYRHVSPEYWLTGKPEDPTKWPVEDVEVCEGGLNLDCNSGVVLPNFFQHGEYLGPMICQNFVAPNFFNGVYIPEYIQQELTNIVSGNDEAATFGFEECFAPRA